MIKITSIIKLIIIGIWTLFSIILASIALLVTFRSKSAMWVAHKIWTPPFFIILRVKMKVSGISNIDKNKNYIILANHTSNLDIPMMTAGLPIIFYYLAKKEMRKIPFLGWIMMASGIIFIDRGNKDKAIRSLRIAGKKIKKGKSVMIFPEGTFDGSVGLLPFKKGAFHLAMHADSDILPVAIINAESVWPEHSSLQLRPGKVELRIGKPISTRNMTVSEIDEISQKTRESIEELLEN
jgi:1-acyl-sn-glycerol-3-phosphate acyltransferase